MAFVPGTVLPVAQDPSAGLRDASIDRVGRCERILSTLSAIAADDGDEHGWLPQTSPEAQGCLKK